MLSFPRKVQFYSHAKCATHGGFCAVDKGAEWDVSGLPCQPNSAAAAAALVAGRNKKVLSGLYTLSGLFGTSAG